MTSNGKCDVTANSPETAMTADPIAARPTFAVIIVTDTEGGMKLLILLTWTYYSNAKDVIHKQLYNYVEINVVITLF